MENRKLDQSKVEGLPANRDKPGRYSIIVKVNKENYVPSLVSIRQKISPYIFTAEATNDTIAILEQDDSVASISISHSLPMID